MSHIVDRKIENYKKLLFFCKIPPESKKKEQFKNGAFLFSFSILTVSFKPSTSMTGVTNLSHCLFSNLRRIIANLL